jgi:branched-chain amino acid transport system ATP-binding protein
MNTAPTLLSVEGLSKSYGGVHAVRGVSFKLKAGEILALIGPNGAGKSTCFDMLNGQTMPGAGKISLLGHDTTGERPRAIWRLGVGRTFQITATFPTMTVRENIQVALVSYHRQLFNLWASTPMSCSRWSAWTAMRIVRAGKSPMAISSGWSLPSRSPTSRSSC